MVLSIIRNRKSLMEYILIFKIKGTYTHTEADRIINTIQTNDIKLLQNIKHEVFHFSRKGIKLKSRIIWALTSYMNIEVINKNRFILNSKLYSRDLFFNMSFI